jgi:predicted nucleic acid-binding protein
MTERFADTFYFLGILNIHDQYSEVVEEFNRDLLGRIVTTDWVLMELADALASSRFRGHVREYISYLREFEMFELVRADDELFDRALSLYNRHIDKDWSLTDCTSFIVMRDRGITEALTGDKHFEQAGFVALLK